MERTSGEIYGPVIKIIRKMQTATPSEKRQLEEELYGISEKIMEEFKAFDCEYSKIRDNEMELEEKIRELNRVLDEKMKNTAPFDVANNIEICRNIYKGSWDKLNVYSQQYLAMANYLFTLFLQNGKDYSPSVLEYGRAIENELLKKIYAGYVEKLNNTSEEMIDHGSRYGELKKAVKSFRQNNGEFYIPARAMVKYLSYLTDKTIENPYNEKLKHYLYEKKIEQKTLADVNFTSAADEIFDKYRNSAAHSGKVIELNEANECKEKSQNLIIQFMRAINNKAEI